MLLFHLFLLSTFVWINIEIFGNYQLIDDFISFEQFFMIKRLLLLLILLLLLLLLLLQFFMLKRVLIGCGTYLPVFEKTCEAAQKNVKSHVFGF